VKIRVIDTANFAPVVISNASVNREIGLSQEATPNRVSTIDMGSEFVRSSEITRADQDIKVMKKYIFILDTK
jgi:hypothetical protein